MSALSILYDGQCPFCRRYTDLLRLRQSVGEVRLVDLRRDSVIMGSDESFTLPSLPCQNAP